VIILFLLVLSCEKSSQFIQKFKSEDYPMSLNSYWVYERTDVNQNQKDTIRETVKANNFSVGDVHGLWLVEQESPQWSEKDTVYVLFKEDTITYYGHIAPSPRLYFWFSYIFPMEQDSSWNYGAYDRHTVLDNQASSAEFGNLEYGNGFLIERSQATFGVSTFSETLLIKNIGIVWKEILGTQRPHYIYRLIDYHIEKS